MQSPRLKNHHHLILHMQQDAKTQDKKNLHHLILHMQQDANTQD
jgi:hypothetical protein